MKKLFPLALCLCLLATLCACGQAAPEVTAAPTTQATTTLATTTTTEPPTTTQAFAALMIQCPKAYKNAPKAYWPILDDLFKTVYIIANGILTDDFWGRAEIQETPSIMFVNGEFCHGRIGYAVKDINKDGISELILLYDSEDPSMLSLFTLKNNKPVHLDSYWRRSFGHLAADGTIYTRGSCGAGASSLSSDKLKPGASKLTNLTNYYIECIGNDIIALAQYDGENGKGRKINLTEEEWLELDETYSNPPKPMKLEFIPIEQ